MSRVIDGHGTSLDYTLRAMIYGKMADFLEGNEEARREGGWSNTARESIAHGLWALGVSPVPDNYNGRTGLDFFDDFMRITVAKKELTSIADPKLAEDLRRYDEAFTRAERGEVFSSDSEVSKLFRGMAGDARRKADSIAYRAACGYVDQNSDLGE